MLYRESPEDTVVIRDWLTPILDAKSPGRTAKDLAAYCGVSPQAVSGWKRTGRIKKSLLIKACAFLGSTPKLGGDGSVQAREPEVFWPFPDIPASRWDRLTANQRIEMQGLVRERIERFEASNTEAVPVPAQGKRRRA